MENKEKAVFDEGEEIWVTGTKENPIIIEDDDDQMDVEEREEIGMWEEIGWDWEAIEEGWWDMVYKASMSSRDGGLVTVMDHLNVWGRKEELDERWKNEYEVGK